MQYYQNDFMVIYLALLYLRCSLYVGLERKILIDD